MFAIAVEKPMWLTMVDALRKRQDRYNLWGTESKYRFESCPDYIYNSEIIRIKTIFLTLLSDVPSAMAGTDTRTDTCCPSRQL